MAGRLLSAGLLISAGMIAGGVRGCRRLLQATTVADRRGPSINEEAEFPSEQLQQKLEAILGKPGQAWSFRVLNGDVSKALSRLAENAGAALLVVGAGRPGSLARLDRALEGSVSAALIHRQQRPVLIIPEPGNQPAR
ncbi:universal stress protein family protein [Arthrobacter sp. SLBN-100]|nr:universal stress protein family protein [Arthrobacter sp. SLBN-100]